MHELSLISDLLNKIEDVARREGALRVTRVRVQLGALSHLSPEHFRRHFDDGARGRFGEGADLDISIGTDTSHPHAQDVLLESVDLELEQA